MLGLRPDAPRGTPRTTAPALFSVVLASEPVPREDQHRLRLVHRSNQTVEPEGDQDIWAVSARELCMFSTFGFSWVVTDSNASQFLADTPHLIRDRYVYKWLLVEHQRLCLLALATECADMSKGLDQSNFAEMRMRLLAFIATYNFRHVSNEERHDRFYKRSRDALSIDDLLGEVRDEVVEIDTQLAARRAETLNHVLAFLTLVLTPVGILCSVFQTDTIPGPFRFSKVLSSDAWLALATHGPFIMVLIAATLGATVYTRLFGRSTSSRACFERCSRRNADVRVTSKPCGPSSDASESSSRSASGRPCPWRRPFRGAPRMTRSSPRSRVPTCASSTSSTRPSFRRTSSRPT